MTLYHGSAVGGLTELKPYLSEHGKPYIYFSTNPVVALLYTVRPVSKPFSWYPYGFDGNTVIYSEYYPNAFADIYKGKKGFLYATTKPVVAPFWPRPKHFLITEKDLLFFLYHK